MLRGRQRHPRDGAAGLTDSAQGEPRPSCPPHKVIEKLWQEFADLGDLERNALDVGGQSPKEAADLLDQRLKAGLLTL